MFIEAAAKTWGVPAGEVTLDNGVIAHASGKTAGFADLLDEAAKVTPPATPKLKDPATFTLIGTDRVRRKDSAAKSTGAAALYPRRPLPKMLTAMVAHPPRFGGTVKSFDDTVARKVRASPTSSRSKAASAVVATSTWAAKQGRDALKVEWDESKAETRGTAAIAQQYRDLAAGKLQAPEKTPWAVFDSKGEAARAAGGSAAVEVAYDFPYLAHATMEPMNCVAIVKGNSAHLLFGSQIPTVDQLNTAQIVGNLPGAIRIDTLFAGGSFGRRATSSPTTSPNACASPRRSARARR
jgi:isoquinoline 1-oxidoreductase beta subunit